MKRFYLILVVFFTSIIGNAQILTFDFAGLTGSEPSANSNFNDPNIGASTITRGAGLTASNNGNRFNATSWALSNIANAVAGNDYMEFTITPTLGCNFSITSIYIQLQRSGTGPREVALRSSADGYTTNLGGIQTIIDNTSNQNFTFTFLQNNITAPTTYRFYMWAESTGGSGGIGDAAGNDIIVYGSTNCSANSITLSSVSSSPFSVDCGSGSDTPGSVNFSSVGTFNAGNVYSVELSDATGSFASSTTIGSITSTANSGSIPISIPFNTTTGTNYLMRIVSNNPGATSNNSSPLTITQTNPCGLTTGAVSGGPFQINCENGITDAGTVAFNAVAVMQAGNIYTVEISDEFGNFTAPITVGTLNSTANSGTIPITIPAGLNSGTLFRVRISSSAPAMNGDTSAVFSVTQMQPCTPVLPSSNGLIINEFSNGPAGTAQEYYEFVVAGKCGDLVDIRGFILDDNNGTFTTPPVFPLTGSGVASGHFRFSNDPQWASIPVGSLIVIYNACDRNPLIPADDPNDTSPNDSLYVVPHTSPLFEVCTSRPIAPSDSTYSPCTYATASSACPSTIGSWGPLGLRNDGDAIQVRSPNGNYYHGISYGGPEISGGPHNLKLFTGSGSGMVGWFNSGDFYDISMWSSGSAPVAETPGLPNNAANLQWLRLMRDSLNVNCPVNFLPVELKSFDGFYNQKDANELSWITLSERNASNYVVERSIDGKTWEQVNYQNAIGNTTTESSYYFDDKYFVPGKVNYYRLNQTDFNGVNTVFNKNIIAIDNTNSRNKNIVKIVNILGQEISSEDKGVQIIIYDDGTMERVFKM